MVAWASLVGQTAILLWRGGRGDDDETSVLISMVLGALVVGYVSAGVVRARTVRLVLAWVVLVLSGVAELIALAFVDDLARAAFYAFSLGTTVVALAGLVRFRRSDWYAWQRTRPPTYVGAPIRHLVAIGVLVGVLGGWQVPSTRASRCASTPPSADRLRRDGVRR